MDQPSPHNIDIQVHTRYLYEQSAPEQNRYVFNYTIRLRNRGERAAQLIARHWIITDANGKVEEVRGPGVAGEQPWLQPGEDYEYTSGAILETIVGTMHGAYSWVADDGDRFESQIPRFALSIPRTLH